MKKENILGAIIADGTSQRMQDSIPIDDSHSLISSSSNSNPPSSQPHKHKCFSLLAKKPLIGHVIDRATDQVDLLTINISNKYPLLSTYGLPIIPDVFLENKNRSELKASTQLGPLAGVASVMQWALKNENGVNSNHYQWLATFPCDTPFFPHNLVDKLIEKTLQTQSVMTCAVSEGKTSPLCGIWSMTILPTLIHYLENKNRKVMSFLESIHYETVNFEPESSSSIDPFFNINSPEQLKTAESFLHSKK